MDLTTGDNERCRALRRKFDKMRALGRTDVEWLNGAEVIKRKAPHLASADIEVGLRHESRDGC